MRMVKIFQTFYHSYDMTWSAMSVWIWTGLEAHMAVIIASLPALNHYFRRVLKESSISDRFKSIATRGRYASRYGSGYNKTVNSTVGDHTNASDKGVIHVTQEIQLRESVRDSKYEQKMGHSVSIDEEAMRKDKRAWSDNASSDDDSIRKHTLR